MINFNEIRPPTREDRWAWMDSFRQRHGASPYQVLRVLEDPSPETYAEAHAAWATARMYREALDE